MVLRHVGRERRFFQLPFCMALYSSAGLATNFSQGEARERGFEPAGGLRSGRTRIIPSTGLIQELELRKDIGCQRSSLLKR